MLIVLFGIGIVHGQGGSSSRNVRFSQGVWSRALSRTDIVVAIPIVSGKEPQIGHLVLLSRDKTEDANGHEEINVLLDQLEN